MSASTSPDSSPVNKLPEPREPARANFRGDKRPHVVIVGGGFGGLEAAKSLGRAPVDVTLIDRRNFHLFQPLLYQVATGELSPANIAAPLRSLLRSQKNTRVLLGEVSDVCLESSTLQLTDAALRYDYLIVAAGASHHYFGNDQWSPIAPGLKTLENATEIRRQILGAFEAAERAGHDPATAREILTFVIVGAGPTGCELAGALAEIAHHTLGHDFRAINPAEARIVVVESGQAPLDVYPEPLPSRTADDLRRLGVELITGSMVTDVHPTHVVITDNETQATSEIRARTVIWAAGVRANAIGARLCDQVGLTAAAGGRVPVREDTSIESFPSVFVVGDLAWFDHGDRGPLPGLAPVASQMGRHASRCVLADIRGKPRPAFRYHDRGSMAVIGRYAAVGVIFGLKVRGFVAWFLWLFVHLMYITRFRNRVLVLIQWGWTYFTHDRSARLIADGPSDTIPTMEESTGWDEDPAMRPQDRSA